VIMVVLETESTSSMNSTLSTDNLRLRHKPQHYHQQQSMNPSLSQSHSNSQNQLQDLSRHASTLSASASSSVNVAIRIRPLLPFEYGNEACIQVFSNSDNHHDQADIPIISAQSSDSTLTTLPAWSESQPSSSSSPTSNVNTSEFTSPYSNHHHIQQPHTLSPSTSTSSYTTVQVGGGVGDTDQSNLGKTFAFDHVFRASAEQIEVYEGCVAPLVQSCLEGYNATVLAYGQTGSGKTHTILGESSGSVDDVEGTLSNQGVVPRALKEIFNGLEDMKIDAQRRASFEENQLLEENGDSPDEKKNGGSENNKHGTSSKSPSRQNSLPYEYQIKIQFLELYGEDIRDLLDSSTNSNPVEHDFSSNNHHQNYGNLSPRMRRIMLTRQSSNMSAPSVLIGNNHNHNITIRDGKAGKDAEVIGASQIKVTNASVALDHLTNGLKKRVVGKTAMNAHSSRSHAIFTVVIQQTTRKRLSVDEKMHVEMKTSKIHFVDLSGSERVKRSKTVGKSLKEGIDINKGLLVLGNVISALSKSKTHVPYRDSKLTRLLKGSLGGNHKTLMIACVSPSSSNTAESINTLRYANRAKNIKNKAKINVDPASRVVNELKSQVVALAAELLRVRKLREQNTNDDSNDEFEDCPFSIDFLGGLIRGGDSQSLWKRNMSQTYQLQQQQRPMKPITPDRPATAPVTPLREDESVDSRTEIKTVYNMRSNLVNKIIDEEDEEDSEGNEESDSAEDPELDKNILSYDFALAKLRESLENATNGVHSPARSLRSRPGLGKVRNIDELYEYLNQAESVYDDNVSKGDTKTITSEHIEYVVADHIAKLDDTISQNQTLLKQMVDYHERYKNLVVENERNLFEVNSRIKSFEKEKKIFEEVGDMLEEGSQYSIGMAKSADEKEENIMKLKKKQEELQVVQKVAFTHSEEMQDLKNAIQVMKRQRSELKRIFDAPLDAGPTETELSSKFRGGDLSQSYDEENHHLTERTLRRHNLASYDSGDEHAQKLHIVRELSYEHSEISHDHSEEHLDDDEGKILKLQNEVKMLKQKLIEKERMEQEMREIDEAFFNHVEDEEEKLQELPKVPTTLTLNEESSSENFSALGASNHTDGILIGLSGKLGASFESNNNVYKQVKARSSVKHSKRQELKSSLYEVTMRKNSDDVGSSTKRRRPQYKTRAPLPRKPVKSIFDAIDDANRVDTNNEDAKPSQSTDNGFNLSSQLQVFWSNLGARFSSKSAPGKVKRKKMISRMTLDDRYNDNDTNCVDMCGATHIVQLARRTFGYGKNPVVRQW